MFCPTLVATPTPMQTPTRPYHYILRNAPVSPPSAIARGRPSHCTDGHPVWYGIQAGPDIAGTTFTYQSDWTRPDDGRTDGLSDRRGRTVLMNIYLCGRIRVGSGRYGDQADKRTDGQRCELEAWVHVGRIFKWAYADRWQACNCGI